jgi:tetratricopeptide (TPR) repeat protein
VVRAQQVLKDLIANPGDEAAAARRWARRNLALTLAGTGEYADGTAALELLKANLNEQPDAPEDTRARALVLASRPGGRRESIEQLEKSFAVLPATPGEVFLHAQLYDQDGNWARATELINRLLDDGPGRANPTILAWYVKACLRHRDPATAAVWLDRLRGLEKEAPRTVELEARLLAATDQKARAVEVLREFVRRAYKAKPNPVVLLGVGLLLAELKMPAEAEEFLKQYVQEAKVPTAPLVLVDFYARQNRPADALGVCEKALPTAGPEPTARSAVGILRLAEVGPADAARVEAVVGKAVQAVPDSLDVQISLADLRDAQGRYADAKRIYRAVLARDRTNQLAMNNLGWLLAVEEGNPAEADRLLTEAIAHHGPVANLLDTRGMARLALRRYEEAIDDLSQAVAQTPDPQLYFHLALAYHRSGNAREAERTMRKVVELELPVRQLHHFERADYQEMLQLVEKK